MAFELRLFVLGPFPKPLGVALRGLFVFLCWDERDEIRSELTEALCLRDTPSNFVMFMREVLL